MKSTDILTKFLNLPLGDSNAAFEMFARMRGSIRRGEGDRQFLYVRGKRSNRILLVAHADTFWDGQYAETPEPQKELVFDEGKIQNKAGGLGADDRAGCAIIWLLKNLGHSILITNGEEKGGLGSRWLMDQNQDIADEINRDHRFAIQLDRRNSSDFKCYSVGTDDFRTYVQKSTGYSEPDRVAYTDIVSLCRDICGVNLSIGYYNEHTANEYLVINEWKTTLKICRRWLSRTDLPRFERTRDAE